MGLGGWAVPVQVMHVSFSKARGRIKKLTEQGRDTEARALQLKVEDADAAIALMPEKIMDSKWLDLLNTAQTWRNTAGYFHIAFVSCCATSMPRTPLFEYAL